MEVRRDSRSHHVIGTSATPLDGKAKLAVTKMSSPSTDQTSHNTWSHSTANTLRKIRWNCGLRVKVSAEDLIAVYSTLEHHACVRLERDLLSDLLPQTSCAI
jgi:hypothetical protein